jgi:hypothetical protein
MTEETGYEELAQPRPGRVPVGVLLVLLVLGVAAIAVVRIAGADSPAKKPVALPSGNPPSHTFAMPTLEPSSSSPPDVVAPTSALRYRSPRVCPQASDGQNACSTYQSVSPQFLRAVRVGYPKIVVDSAVTQLLRASGPEVDAGLWSVEFTGFAHGLRLRIAVARAEPTDHAIEGSLITSRRGSRFEFMRVVRGRYTIQFEELGNVNDYKDFGKLARLAADRRLRVPPAATMDG